jgi:nucleotide-binding universal stress UspA family protein
MYDTIVVPVDLSPASLHAVDAAVRFARAWTVPIELVTVSSPGIDPATTEAELRRITAEVDAPLRPLVTLASNDVPGALTAHLHTLTRPLLCMATHGRTALGTAVLGSTAHAILEAVDVPVVLVGPRCVAPGEVAEIVVAVEPGTDPARQIAEAVRWAKATNARLHLLAVERAGDARADAVREQLDALAQSCRATGVDARWRLLDGDVALVLADAAEEVGAAAIVMGSSPRGGRIRYALGDVGRQLVRRAPCPVLAVSARCAPAGEGGAK